MGLKAEEIVAAQVKPTESDIDFKGLAVGLISVMTGTFGLALRTFLRD